MARGFGLEDDSSSCGSDDSNSRSPSRSQGALPSAARCTGFRSAVLSPPSVRLPLASLSVWLSHRPVAICSRSPRRCPIQVQQRLVDRCQFGEALSVCSSMRWLGDVQRGRAFRKYFVFVNRVLASNDQVKSVTYVQQPSHGSSSRPCADYSLHASQNMPTGHVLKKNCRRRLTGKLILFDFFFVLYAIGWASKCAVNPRLADGIRSYHSVNDTPRHPMVPT